MSADAAEILAGEGKFVGAPDARDVRFENRKGTTVCVVRMSSGALVTFCVDAAALARCAESLIAVMEVQG